MTDEELEVAWGAFITTDADAPTMWKLVNAIRAYEAHKASAVPIVGPLFDARDTPPDRILDDGPAVPEEV